jgi:hypothetical protein
MITKNEEIALLDNFQRKHGELQPYHYVVFSEYKDGTVFARLMMDEDYGSNTLIKIYNMGKKEDALKSWRDVKCPLCGADAGFNCRLSTRRKYGYDAIEIPQPHKKRLELAKSEGKQ